MFSRDSENGVTLELEFLQTSCIRQFFTHQIHLESDSSKFSTANNLRYTVYVGIVDEHCPNISPIMLSLYFVYVTSYLNVIVHCG